MSKKKEEIESKEPKTATVKGESAPTPVEIKFIEGADEQRMVNPREIRLPPFDSRSTPGVLGDDFKSSIKNDGVIQPVLLARVTFPGEKTPCLMVVAGRKRNRAAIEMGLPEIPAYIKSMTYKQALSFCVKENLHRTGLNAYDLAQSFKQMLDAGMAQDEIAAEVSRSQAFVSHHLAILEMPDPIQKLVRSGKLDVSRVRELIRLKAFPEEQIKIAEKAVANEADPWTSADIREAVEQVKVKKEAAEQAKAKPRKVRTKNANGEEEEEEEEKEEKSYFDWAQAEVANKKVHLNYAESLARKQETMREKAPGDDAKDEDRVEYEKKFAFLSGQLDAAKRLCGFAALPKPVIDASV